MINTTKDKREIKKFTPLRKALKEVKLSSGETVELHECGIVYHITAEIEQKKPKKIKKTIRGEDFESWLAEVEKVANLCKGKFDAVKTLRRIRNES